MFSATSAAMNFFLAMLAWIVIGLVLAVGLYLWATKGLFWVFALIVVAFIGAVGKIGCSTH